MYTISVVRYISSTFLFVSENRCSSFRTFSVVVKFQDRDVS